jgi:hypothetical protein
MAQIVHNRHEPSPPSGKQPNIHSITGIQSVGLGTDIPHVVSRLDERKRCWRVLQGAPVHEAVDGVCISVDTCVERGVENLWINPKRADITADGRFTTPDI